MGSELARRRGFAARGGAINGPTRVVACTVLALAAGMAVDTSAAASGDERARQWAEAVAWRAGEAQRRQREARLRWEYERRRSAAHSRMPNTLYASTPSSQAHADLSCPALVDDDTRRLYWGLVDDRRRAPKVLTAPGMASGDIARNAGINVFPARRRGPSGSRSGLSASPTKADTPSHLIQASAWLPATYQSKSATEGSQHVYLFPSASEPFRQGFVRVINHSAEAGDVSIDPVDDSGREFDTITLSINANETVHFNSDDLEMGNTGKGLSGSTGSGEGDWRLAFSSDLDIEVLSYIRTEDGFLTAMHDVAPVEGNVHRVAIFNPSSNKDQVSRLRLINPTDETAEVTIRGTDDKGMPGTGEVSVSLDSGTAREITAEALESGDDDFDGMLGDGSGKWRLAVESEQSIVAMSLLESPTDHLTNLSTVPEEPEDGVHVVPLFPKAGDESGRQGFVRAINRSDTAGEIIIQAYDESERDYEAVTLGIGANEVVHFNSDDLEQGSSSKGLSGGVGAGQGDWRLELTSDLEIEVLSYIRTTDGFLTSMHDVAPSAETRHRVAVFNPGSNRNQESLLGLINPGEETAEVTITGIDDKGVAPSSAVSLSLPGGSSRTVGAWDLESGAEGLDGALGDGSGKWQLMIESDRPVAVMSLLRSPTGHLTNLSTAPVRGARGGASQEPQTAEAVFRQLISGPIMQSKCINCHVEGGASANTRLVFVRDENPDHEVINLQVFEDFLDEEEDGASYILNKIQGALGHGGGIQVAAGTDEYASMERFLSLLGADVGPVAITPDTLFDGVKMELPRQTLRRAAIVFTGRLPTAEEYKMIETGGLASMRTAIRGLMEGRGFHDFLVRGANDRLLTDREFDDPFEDAEGYFVEYTNTLYRLHSRALAGDWRELVEWTSASRFGAARAPLELIAHVVENDLPYTEILTADYIMANWGAALAYGAPTDFDGPRDLQEFRPSEIASYYRKGEGHVEEEDEIGVRVVDPGPLSTAYPHAGILNTKSFLQRYPTTATNRNRARSRWTYYHFLGLDVEKSASRTTDPVALSDTNNPTLHNPACTVCHRVLDPVAGTYQNYGENGLYRDKRGGLDSLDERYKDGGTGKPGVPLEGRNWPERETVEWSESLVVGRHTVAVWAEDGFGAISLDRLDLFSPSGEHLQSWEFEDLQPPEEDGGSSCAEAESNEHTGEMDYVWLWGDRLSCAYLLEFDTRTAGTHTFEVVAWTHPHDDNWRLENQVAHGRVKLAMRFYREGDTWYHDMRRPGFAGEQAPPRATNSLQWLAARLVQDERFAESAVKFWWPAIMGTDVAEAPEDASDRDFEGRLLASNAMAAEVSRLASDFQSGIRGGSPYNLKDLLVEIVLSPWFRAESMDTAEGIRTTALREAGARRLLTPEELARKTEALTGFQWGRRRSVASWGQPDPARLNALVDTDEYGLLYGGIDADGIIERARGMTSVMASVASTHALATSCPIVLREFHMLRDDERRLFTGIDLATAPEASSRQEFARTLEISADSPDALETLSAGGRLGRGQIQVRIAKVPQVASHEGETWNGVQQNIGARTWEDRATLAWEISLAAGENAVAVWGAEGFGGVNLDRLEVVGADGELVSGLEFEELAVPVEGTNRVCGEKPLNPATSKHDHMRIWGDRFSCAARATVDVETAGAYTVRVVAWGDVDSGGAEARLAFAVNPEPAPVVLWLERVVLRDDKGTVVAARDLHRGMNEGSVEISMTVPETGHYDLEVAAWASNLGEDPATFEMAALSYAEVPSAAGRAIRAKLVDLHGKLLGVEAGLKSVDVETAYQLFFDVWLRKRGVEEDLLGGECDWGSDLAFLDDELEEAVIEHVDDEGWHYWESYDWDRVHEYFSGLDTSDPNGVARAWVVVLAYLMSDYRYLHL